MMSMTALEKLAEALFPGPLKTPEEYEALYPPCSLPEGARVTRIAPSPTGFLHLGVFSPPWSTGWPPTPPMGFFISGWRIRIKSGRSQAARRISSAVSPILA